MRAQLAHAIKHILQLLFDLFFGFIACRLILIDALLLLDTSSYDLLLQAEY